MSDLKKERLSLSRPIGSQKGEEGHIRQSFSHGRSKMVTVEIKKKRVFTKKNLQNTELDKTSLLAKKTGLTNTELENRIKAVQELAGSHIAEAHKRAASADEAVSNKISIIKQKEEEQKALEEQQKQAKAIENSAASITKADDIEKKHEESWKSKPNEFDKTTHRKISDKKPFRSFDNKKEDRLISANKKRNDKFPRKDGEQKPRKFGEHQNNLNGVKRPFGRSDDQNKRTNNFVGNKPQFSRIPSSNDFQTGFDYNDEKKLQPKVIKSHIHGDRDFEEDDNKTKQIGNGQPIKRDKDEILSRSMERQSKLSIYNALDDNDDAPYRSGGKRAKSKNRQAIKSKEESQKIVREVAIPDTITVQELSNRMAVRVSDLIKSLMKMGIMATINQVIDADTAELVVLELGHKVKRVGDFDVVSELINVIHDNDSDLLPRPPIVTIMGHVDHGKTSLLDAIRKTDVALNEAGGITQKIGAYQIMLGDSRKITFIDTPGHAAFTEMRARGTNVTDVVVLVVAADDGVKEQTVEALNHAKAAGVPIIIAINKMDKPGADPNRVRNDLLNYGIVVESLGGDTIDVEVSAKTGINLDKLESCILLQADILELKANPNRTAEATVIEAKIEKGLGPVATILVQKGTLKVGDIFVSGTVSGKVRAIKNDLRQNLDKLLPGSPGEIIGFNNAPLPGDDFIVVDDEAKAKEIADIRARKKKEKEWIVSRGSASDMLAKIASDSKLQAVPVIIKADTQGSIEAISDSLTKLSTNEIQVNILHSGVGGITENDVILANASNALVLGFNVRANAQAKDQSQRDGIDIKYYSVIYDLIDDVRAIMSGMLSPTLSERVIGSAEVRQIFDISKVGKVAGCMVISGVIKRTAKVRILRDDVVIHTGEVKSIHKKKDDVKEVKEGFECGIVLESYSDIHVKDILEFFEIDEIARIL